MPDPVTLVLGRRSLAERVATLRRAGVRLNAYAEALLATGGVRVAPTPQTVQVVVHTVGELGWSEGVAMDPLLRDVAERGLAPCPLEVALELRLAWLEQPVSPRITVASTRAHPDEARPRGFYLRDDDEGCWLRAYVASHDWIMDRDERLALVRAES